MKAYILLGVAIVANLVTNYSFKQLATSVNLKVSAASVVEIVTSVWAWCGAIGGGVLLVSFVLAIRELPLSIAYPVLTAVVIIALTIIDYWIFSIPIGALKLTGVIFTVCGIALLTMTTTTAT